MTFASLLGFLLLNLLFIVLAGGILAFLMLARIPAKKEFLEDGEYNTDMRSQLLNAYISRFVQIPNGIPVPRVLALTCGTMWIINLWNMLFIMMVPSLDKTFNSMNPVLAAMLVPCLALLEASVVVGLFRSLCCSGPDLVETLFFLILRRNPRE